MLPIRPTHDGVFIDIVDRDQTTKDLGGGKKIHFLSDDSAGLYDPMAGGALRGARPRWARILGLGPDCVTDLQVGDLVLCDYGKWSRGFPIGRDGLEIVRMWRIKEGDILGMNPDAPSEEYIKEMGDKIARLDLTIGHL